MGRTAHGGSRHSARLHFRQKEFADATNRYTALIDLGPALIPADRKKYLGDSYQNRAFVLWFGSHDADKAFADLEKSKAEAISDSTLDTWRTNLESDGDFAIIGAAEPAGKQALLA